MALAARAGAMRAWRRERGTRFIGGGQAPGGLELAGRLLPPWGGPAQ